MRLFSIFINIELNWQKSYVLKLREKQALFLDVDIEKLADDREKAGKDIGRNY